MTELAAALDTPVASVYGVATFYNQFRFAPLGAHVIELCRGTACHVKQSLALQQHLQRRLKLRPDGNSADKRFTVLNVACLGACSIAPVIKLDGEFYGHLTIEKLDALLDGSTRRRRPRPAPRRRRRARHDHQPPSAALLRPLHPLPRAALPRPDRLRHRAGPSATPTTPAASCAPRAWPRCGAAARARCCSSEPAPAAGRTAPCASSRRPGPSWPSTTCR